MNKRRGTLKWGDSSYRTSLCQPASNSVLRREMIKSLGKTMQNMRWKVWFRIRNLFVVGIIFGDNTACGLSWKVASREFLHDGLQNWLHSVRRFYTMTTWRQCVHIAFTKTEFEVDVSIDLIWLSCLHLPEFSELLGSCQHVPNSPSILNI